MLKSFLAAAAAALTLAACGGGDDSTPAPAPAAAAPAAAPATTSADLEIWAEKQASAFALISGSWTQLGSALWLPTSKVELTTLEVKLNAPDGVENLYVAFEMRSGITITTPAISTPAKSNSFALSLIVDEPVKVRVYGHVTAAAAGKPLQATLGVNTTFVDMKTGVSAQLDAEAPMQEWTVRRTLMNLQMLSQSGPQIMGGLYQFQVSADPAGAGEWKRLVLDIETAGSIQLSECFLVYDDLGQLIADSDPQGPCPKVVNGQLVIDLTKNSATYPTYQQVVAGGTRTYTVSAWSWSFGSPASLSIKLAPNGFVWSDRSAPSHTIDTGDWWGMSNSSMAVTYGF